MARKSRRNKNVEAVSNQIIENGENLIDTGAYIRVSVENSGNETDETLVVQQMLFGEDGIFRIVFDDYGVTETICSVSLIFIIFYGGFGTNVKEAKSVAAKALLLSTLGVALTTGFVGVFVHLVLRLPWLESFLFGSVIASTDAASVFNILRTKKLDLKYHTASLLELESGSNDPVSYMLTVVFIAMMSGKAVSLPLMLAQQIGFGLVCGAAAGRLAVWAMDRFSFQIEEGNTIFAVAAMLVSYALPQVIGGNGYLAVYLCGIIMGNSRIPEKRNLMHVFDTVTGIAQMMIFFLLGLLATPSELPAVLLPAALIMLFMTVIARPAAVAAILLPFRSHIRQIGVVSWAGLRGAASIVFAIMAVLSKVPMHYNLYNLVFCVVLLSIAVQGTFLPLVSEKLRMIDRNMDVRRTFNDYEEESSIHFVKTHIQEGHLFCGKRVRDISLPPEMLIVMILRGEEKRIPNGDTLLLAGDLLILAAPEFTEGENLILRERTTVKGDKWTGKTLKEVPLSKGTLVVSVRRGEETLIPTGNTRIQEGDILIIAKY